MGHAEVVLLFELSSVGRVPGSTVSYWQKLLVLSDLKMAIPAPNVCIDAIKAKKARGEWIRTSPVAIPEHGARSKP